MYCTRLLLVIVIPIIFFSTKNNTRMNAVDSLTPTAATTNSKIVSAILFDIDGTLVNTDSIHYAVFRELLAQEQDFRLTQQQRKIDEEFFRHHISGRSNDLITKDFFPLWSLERRQAFSTRKEATFRERAHKDLPHLCMPGLDKIRQYVDHNHLGKVAVTNAPRLNAEAMLRGIGYQDWFGTEDGLIIGDECARPKPDPCPYLMACQRIFKTTTRTASPTTAAATAVTTDNSITAEHCLVFEDSPSGIRAGIAAGAVVIGITSGQDARTLREAGCHLTIQDFNDPKLWNYLKTLTIIPPPSLPPLPASSLASSSSPTDIHT